MLEDIRNDLPARSEAGVLSPPWCAKFKYQLQCVMLLLIIHSGCAIPRLCYHCSFLYVRAEVFHMYSAHLLHVFHGAMRRTVVHCSVAPCSWYTTLRIQSKEHYSKYSVLPLHGLIFQNVEWATLVERTGQESGVGRLPAFVASGMDSGYATCECQSKRHPCFWIVGSCQTGEPQQCAYLNY